VALGRALVREPRAFLFDEPLSALDALLRLEMRAELKHLQRDLGRTLVYVTHDQVEAMSMPDRVAVLREGVVQQVDTPENVYHRPLNRFVATVVGSPPMNFLPCTAAGSRNGALHLRHPLFEVDVLARELPPGTIAEGAECLIGVRPEDVRVQTAGEDSFPATVYVSEPLGGETVVDLQVGHLLVKALAPASLQVEQDTEVQISLDPSRLHLFTGTGESVLSAAGENLFVVHATATSPAAPRP
jgi:multiple sugar transport system ATP-binding protein